MNKIILILFVYLASSSLALALPPNGEVTVGGATFSTPNSATLQINQLTDKVVIEYPQFSIGAGETVQFIQPNSQSIALNRVTGANPSQIFGQLQANGQVFLVNPNGIVFAPGSQIDVGGLVATTLDINNADFMAGNYKFSQTDGAQNHIVNQGQLQAIPEGYIALIATRVTNEGTISADYGNVALVSADKVQIQIAGNQFAIQTDAASWNGLIDNQNLIEADGGVVLLEANTENRLFETVINNDGIIKANRLENRGGEIWLKGGSQGDIWQAGKLDASGKNGAGGIVNISGHRIAHSGDITVSADGDGGQVNLLADATVVLTSGSVIQANASSDRDGDGDGGQIKVFSPNTAIFREGATISATGGAHSGDGGFIDVSGWKQVESAGSVDLTAANGNTGEFLIDPWNITIDSADANGSFDGGALTNTWAPSATGSTVNAATITTNLATANVSIRTDGGGGTEAGNITINSTIDLDGSNGNTLSFVADDSITVNANIADQDTSSADNTNISMTASGSITVTPGNIIDAGGGTIDMTSSVEINLSGLRTTSASASAVNLISNGTINGNASGSTTEIYAPNGGLAFTATGNVNSINTEVASIDFANNAGTLEFTEVDDLTVSGGANSAGITLSAGGVITIPDAGLSPIGALSVTATDIIDSDRSIILNAPTLTLNSGLTGGDSQVNTTATAGALTTTSANTLSINKTDAGDFTVSSLNISSGSASFALNNGTLILPATVTIPNQLTVTAADLFASNITATDLLLRLSAGAGDLSLNTSVDRADVSVVDRNLSLTESDGLIIEDLDSDSSALSTTNGNLTILVQAGDLTINDNVTATDTTADASRTGLIDLSVNGGNINIGSAGAAQIISTNTGDPSANGGLGSIPSNQTAIRIRQTSGANSSSSIILGDASGSDVLIRAVGGDVYVDSLGAATLSAGNSRDLTVNSDATIQAYNNAVDATDGTVSLSDVTNNGTVVAHTARAIQLGGQSLVSTTAPELNNTVTDVVIPVIPKNPKIVIPEETPSQTPVDLLFADVFGDCLTDASVSQQQCQQEQAVRRFMSSLLIGGELQ